MHVFELGNATLLALYVSYEGAEYPEALPARRSTANIYFILVFGARKVLVETSEAGMYTVAEVALVSPSVPRCSGGNIANFLLSRSRASTNETSWVGDNVASVVLPDNAIDHVTVNS